MAKQSHFYVNRFSKASHDIYEQNTHADFTVKVVQPVDLASNSNWYLGLSEISCSSTPIGEETTALMYSNLISTQFVGHSIVRSMRTFVFPLSLSSSSSSICQHEFRNVYYVSVELKRFQVFQIEFLTRGCTFPSRTALQPQNYCFVFENITSSKKQNCIIRGVVI